MNETLNILVELQNIDAIIIERKRIINELPLKMSKFQKPIIEAESLLQKDRELLQSLEKKKRDKESEIEEVKERIRKVRQRSADIKNNKEYEAMLKEIEGLQRGITKTENELLDIMQDVEDIKNKIALGEKEVASQSIVLQEEQKSIQREIEQISLEIKSLKKERMTFVNRLQEDTYRWYMDILKRTRGLAVVEAKNEICKGCNIHIPPQLFVEIKKGLEIYNCPQCRRILYYRIDVKPDEDIEE